jgi:hypothetical protein
LQRLGLLAFSICLAVCAQAEDTGSSFHPTDSLNLLARIQRAANGKQCAEKPGALDLNPEAYGSLNAFCDGLAKDKAPATAYQPDMGPCQSMWKDGTPPWNAWPDVHARASVWASKDFKAPTRNEVLNARGWHPGDPREIDAFLKHAESIRDQTASECCKGLQDEENAECLSAFHGVEVSVCHDEAAERNPDAPDPCLAKTGGYVLSAEASTRIGMLLTESISVVDDAMNKAGGDMEYWREQTRESRKKLPKKPGEHLPIHGGIQFPPFFSGDGISSTPDHMIRHELGHACSDIRRQISAIKPGPQRMAQFFAWLPELGDNFCDLYEPNQEAYKPLFKDIEGGDSILKCLIKENSDSQSPFHPAHIDKDCPAKKLEEASAEALGFLFNTKEITQSVPYPTCDYNPSRIHQASALVFKCLIRNSQSFKARVERDLCLKPAMVSR